MKITEQFLEVAIQSYQDGVSCAQLARWGDVSRQGLWKAMKKAGVEINPGHGTTVCDTCGKEFEKFNSQLKLRIKNYCSPECYYKSIENPDYMPHRHGQRIARRVILECGYRVCGDEVVHHEDGNNDNNDPKNLMVFKNQSDHMKWHRNGNDDVVPVWPPGMVGKPTENKYEKRLKDAEVIAKAQAKLEAIQAENKVETKKGPVKVNKAFTNFMGQDIKPVPKAKWK